MSRLHVGLTCAAIGGLLVLGSCGAAPPTASGPQGHACLSASAPAGARVLVFSRTEGFRHGSIATGAAAIASLGERHGFGVEHTEDPAVFRDDNLGRFAAIVFLNTTGNVLNPEQEAAFERFIRAGGGFVGVHAAADTEYDWEWYGRLVGAYFRSHPAVQPAAVRILDSSHPSTRCQPSVWTRTDEWYDYRAPPAAGISVLAALDESSYRGGRMGEVHPIAWYHRFDGGRAWYTGLGHTSESYAERAFLDHLAGGILWAVTR